MFYAMKSLIAIMVLVASIAGLSMTVNLNLAAVYASTSSHSHTTANDNNFHTNSGSVGNVGGSDGTHQNLGCTSNTSNDKQNCHENIKDRPH